MWCDDGDDDDDGDGDGDDDDDDDDVVFNVLILWWCMVR